LKKQREVLGTFKSEDYRTERRWAVARDGAKVPMSIVYHKDTPLDGTAPLVLYAYGSYGINMTPYFSSVRLSLLDRGYIWVIAHIRGGEEMGRYWYEDGKLLKKMNTFNDFIDCADYMVKEKFTTYDKMVAMGGSAGGLLVGAVANLAPEKFAGIVAQVPFVDVVTTMLDDSIPLTTNEYDEWGNPNIKEYYEYMMTYSPYDNVEAKAYPNILITTGLHDSQVQYWEPAKWTAKLRDMKTDDNLLIMKTEMDYGHGGASGRFQVYKEVAYEYAFIMKVTGK
jgi:oligopeptidase B